MSKLIAAVASLLILSALRVQPPGNGKPSPARVEAENRILVQRLHDFQVDIYRRRPLWGVPKRPNVPGEYHYRYRHPEGDWHVGRMVVTKAMLPWPLIDDGTQWSGPIPKPLEPTEEGGGR